MLHLHWGDDLAAEFTDTGDLVAFVSEGRAWRLREATPACGLVLVQPDLTRRVLLPPVGTGDVLICESASLDVVFRCVCEANGATVDASIRVAWRLVDGLLEGEVLLESLPGGLVLDAVIFPNVSVSVSADGALIWPRLEGVLDSTAGARIHSQGVDASYSFAYPGSMSMQCLGWQEEGRGLYLDSHDTEGWSKTWKVSGEADGGARFQIWHLAPREKRPDGAFAVPYPISLGSFDGSWFDLGCIYRRWALTTSRASRGPDERRESYVGDLACWGWNRGRITDVCPPVKELARRIGLPVALDWYWWHKHGYDTEYPDYFPPREGRDAFMAAVRDLQAHEVRTQVYTNGVGYDLDGASWLPDGPDCVIQKEDGELKAVAYNTYTKHRLAHGCGASALWRGKVFEVVRQAHALGLDGLYIDMVSNVAGADPCFNPRHGHALGGGHYQVEGFRKMWQTLRDAYPSFVLSTEAPSEVFMDLIDAFITINTSNERLGSSHEPIQLWNAVYHGRAVCFGNYALPDGIPPFDELWPQEYRRTLDQEQDWQALCPDQFAIELARTVVGGMQPMVANLKMTHLESPIYAQDMAFLVEVSRFYHSHREWLLWGEMLPPGELQCPDVAVQFLQRMIFTAPGQEKLITKNEPGVLYSAWRAPSGEALAVLSNYTREAQSVGYRPAEGHQLVGPWPDGIHGTEAGIEGVLPARTTVALHMTEAT
ncbi:MAG: hypothetical protein HN976_14690 [Lentisphaerae bacterium]|nr:hypothetical protein [Lentisphaerota bacterium]